MTADVRYCYEDQGLDEVSAIMGDIQVRRLPVLNRDKRLVGIIALGDIALVECGNGTNAALVEFHGQAGRTYRFDPRRAESPAALAGTSQIPGCQAEASTGGTDDCRLNC